MTKSKPRALTIASPVVPDNSKFETYLRGVDKKATAHWMLEMKTSPIKNRINQSRYLEFEWVDVM